MPIYTNTFSGMPVQPANISYVSYSLPSGSIQLEWPLVYQDVSFPVANYIDVDCSSANAIVNMPDATPVSDGQAVIFSNSGSEPFILQKVNGDEIVNPIDPGDSYYIILSDNSTPEGTWNILQLGATTSSADASALAGLGLVALGGKLNTNTSVTSINTPYSVDPVTDRAKIFIWTGGTSNFTLPASGPSVGQAPNGFFVIVNNESNISGVLNVVSTGGQTIDGLSLFSLNPGESCMFIAGGTNWYSFGYGNNANISIGVNNLTSSGGTINLTDDQSGRQVQNISGTLTQNLVINATSIPQQYYLNNNTTGNFTVNFKMFGGSNNNFVPQGTKMQFYCDGTDMYVTPTNNTGVAHFENGTSGAPSVSFQSDSKSGMYSSGSNTVNFAVNSAEKVSLSVNYLDIFSETLPRIETISVFSLNECYD